MKCDIFVMPRGSGKTTKIIEEFLQDPFNTYIMAESQFKVNHIIRTIKEKYPEQSKKITNPLLRRQIKCCDSNALYGQDIKKIFLDDYLMWSEHAKEMFNLNLGTSINKEEGEIIVYTTSNDLFYRNTFLLVRNLRKNSEEIYRFANGTFEAREDIISLFNSLLTHPNSSIYSIDMFSKKNEITDRKIFLEKLKQLGKDKISLNYHISEDILEEFFQEINWSFYLYLNEISDRFADMFKKEIELQKGKRQKYQIDTVIKMKIKSDCELGKLFLD